MNDDVTFRTRPYKVRSPNFGHVWKLCCETSTLSSVISMRLVLNIPSVSFFDILIIQAFLQLVFEINKMEERTLISDT